MGNKDNCVLNRTAPVPWPSPLTRVVSLDSLSPVLSLAVGYGSWQTPLSWSHHLSPHWTSLWARDSAQSSRARVTSSYSHCELSLPSAGDQISGLDHFVDGSEFRTRDLSNFTTSKPDWPDWPVVGLPNITTFFSMNKGKVIGKAFEIFDFDTKSPSFTDPMNCKNVDDINKEFFNLQ